MLFSDQVRTAVAGMVVNREYVNWSYVEQASMAKAVTSTPTIEVETEVSIIVVSFNTREMTLECLRSISSQTLETTYEIIVVDNASNDESASAIRSEFRQIRLIALDENIGFARANNLAVEKACGRRILLLNPDTVILDRAIDRLATFANERPSCGIWGGRTVFKDGSLNPFSCAREMTLWSLACSALALTYLAPNSPVFNPEAYGGWKRDSIRYVDIVSGSFLMIDRLLWDQLGGFDPTFFMYGEEVDLCLRAREAGARPVITPHATIVHHVGASQPSALEQRIKSSKGKMTLVNRHWSGSRRALGRLLFMMVPLTRWGAYSAMSLATRRPDLKLSAGEWRALWRRRSEWIEGYALPAGNVLRTNS